VFQQSVAENFEFQFTCRCPRAPRCRTTS